MLEFKIKLRHSERCWRSRQLAVDFDIYQNHLATFSGMLKAARTLFLSFEVHQCSGDLRALYRLVGNLMGSSSLPSLPTLSSDQEVADDLNQFFCIKVSALTSRFTSDAGSSRHSTGITAGSFISAHGNDIIRLHIIAQCSQFSLSALFLFQSPSLSSHLPCQTW